MSKIHELAFNAEEIDELLDSVDKKTIYQDATQSEHGLMSTTDKTKLDALPTAQQIDNALDAKVDKEAGKGLSKNDYTDADKAKVASALQTETDPTVPSWAKQQNKPSYDYSEIGNTPDLSGFITKSVNDLTNYYLKSETYTKAEVAALIGAIQQFHYEIYPTLPSSGESNVLYLIGPTGSGDDKYEEYVYANNDFTKIGDTSIDLSGYITTSALNTALADYTTTANLTTLLSNKADKVSNATNGNFAGLDANGNLTDSGKKASDFATASQGAKADTAYQKPQTGIPETDLSSDVQSQLNKHFKGWFSSLEELKTVHTAVEGDSAYVKDASPATTWSIYTYDSTATTDNNWADSGTDADTSNVQTFASGEEVNEVHIVNDLTTGGVDDVLSAEQGKVIVDRFSIVQPTEQTINLSQNVVWLEGFYSLDADGSLHARTDTYKASDYINLPSNAKTINYKGGTSTSNLHKQVAVYNDNDECLGTFYQYSATEGVSFDISNLVGATKMRISEYINYITNPRWDLSIVVEFITTNQEVFEDFTQSVDDKFDEVDEQLNNLDNNYYLSAPVDVETNLKDSIVWLEGYYYILSDGTLASDSYSVAKVSEYIDLLPNTKSIKYRGGVDVASSHYYCAIYDAQNNCLATFRDSTASQTAVVFDITEYPTATKMRICEYTGYINSNSWNIFVIHSERQTNKETFDNFVDWVDSLNQWKGKKFIAFGASNTSVGFDSGTAWIQTAAERLKMQPPISGMYSRRVSLKYVDNELNLVGLAATVAECESINADVRISYETQFAKDFDCILFGGFAGESYDESQVVIDGTTYYGGEELIDLIKLPTTRYNNNPQFTYSNGDTLAQHRNSYIGAVIYVLNELWTRKPTCRVVFTMAYLNWMNYNAYSRNFNGIKKLCEKLHLPFIDLVEGVYFNGFTTGNGTQDKTNPNVYLYDGEHASLAGRQRLANIFTHKLLLLS